MHVGGIIIPGFWTGSWTGQWTR